MKRFLFVLALCLMSAGLAFVAPAEAVSIPGCGEFTFYAKNRIAFEQGATTVNGNILVSSPSGLVIVGNHVIINGTVTAHKITVGTGAVVAKCQADIVTGSGTCAETIGTFAAFAADPANATCLVYPLDDPVVVDICVDSALPVNLNVTTSGALVPGCYGNLRVSDNVDLTLAVGTYNFKTIRLAAGSSVTGPNATSPPGDPPGTTVNVKGLFVTANAVVLTNLLINSAQSVGELQIGFASILTNAVFNAPRARIHFHTGSSLRACSELVGESIAVEPVTTEPCEVASPPCVCPIGFEVLGGAPVCTPIPNGI